MCSAPRPVTVGERRAMTCTAPAAKLGAPEFAPAEVVCTDTSAPCLSGGAGLLFFISCRNLCPDASLSARAANGDRRRPIHRPGRRGLTLPWSSRRWGAELRLRAFFLRALRDPPQHPMAPAAQPSVGAADNIPEPRTGPGAASSLRAQFLVLQRSPQHSPATGSIAISNTGVK